MKTLVITPENEEDLHFLKILLEKLDYSAKELTDDEIEDLALLRAIAKAKKGEYVVEEEIKKVLKV